MKGHPNEAKYCFVCGALLHMRYPGGDPENGPATPRCRDQSHPTVEEAAYTWYAPHVVEEYLRDMEHGGYDPNAPEPDEVRLAAIILRKAHT